MNLPSRDYPPEQTLLQNDC